MKQEHKKWAGIAGALLVIILVIVLVNVRNKRADSKITSFDECVNAGYSANESYPRECTTRRGTVHTEYIGNELEVKDLITINNPRPNQEIESPLNIEGLAKPEWFANGFFNVNLVDAEGTIVKTVKAYKNGAKDKDGFNKYKISLKYDLPTTLTGSLVLEKNNTTKDPANDNKLTVPVKFKQPAPVETPAAEVVTPTTPETPKVETPVATTPDTKVKVSVFFNNKDNECEKVVAVEREITKVIGIGEASLNELLKGPTEAEKTAGYTTSINDGTVIKSIKKVGDTVTVDFNAKLGEAVAGSCKVGSIAEQIKKTLTQFPTIKNVVISIEGVSEGILQP